MESSALAEPFVYPVGRDFANRDDGRWKYGTTALAITPIHVLLKEGLHRDISFLTTHTISGLAQIREDGFSLRNRAANLQIPCVVGPRNGQRSLHRPWLEEFQAVPEKLWHALRPWFLVGDPPDRPGGLWYYATRQVRMFRLNLHIDASAEAMAPLEAAFAAGSFNSLSLHLFHSWHYEASRVEMVDGVQYVTPDGLRPVTSVWKDFVVVTRHGHPDRVTIAVGGDFHYSSRRETLSEATADVPATMRAFRKTCCSRWNNGALDLLVMNGDYVDYLTPDEAMPYDALHRPPDYVNSNWRGFTQEMRLDAAEDQAAGCVARVFPWIGRSRDALQLVPILWNAGEHDSLILPYSAPTAYSQGDLGYDPTSSHYNLDGLGSSAAVAPYYASTPYYARTGETATHVVGRRWIHEMARVASWPLWLVLEAGGRAYQIACFDTGTIQGDLAPPPHDVRPVAGLSATSASALDLMSPDRFAIVCTHAPPISLAPDDSRFGECESSFSESEAQYGVFSNHRSAFIAFLRERARGRRPTLVISGHVHFRAQYSISAGGAFTTGTQLDGAIAALTSGVMSPSEFWQRHPVVLITTPAIGPGPGMRTGQQVFLNLELGGDGVSRIAWLPLEF